VGELLAARPPQEDKALSLEIAWHLLRGGEPERAIPFALEGAEAFLAVGAPHEAEEILKAVVAAEPDVNVGRRIRLLLARALLDQSKADEALPVVELLNGDGELILPERAEVARMRASVEFSLNREPGESYCDLAKQALTLAQETGQASLIVRALFECARAGTEAGLTDLVLTAQGGLQQLGELTDINASLGANFTRGFCELLLLEPTKALSSFREAARLGAADRANKAFLSFAYSGIGIALLYLCHLAQARKAFLTALEHARRVGDDARVSIMATNLCSVEGGLGEYDEAIRYGQMSVAWAATNARSPVLGGTHTNLVDAYVLTGREDKALQCLESAEALLGPRPRWRDRCAIVTSRAAMALVQGNLNLALDLISQMEDLARGREDAFPLPGPWWKLKLFRAAHLGPMNEALASASKVAEILRDKCPFHYLDVLAVKAWLERQIFGRQTEETDTGLSLFRTLQVPGKKALLVAQGFLL
jgi:tetratricopeptide (TPR) repeat protein